MGKRRGAAGEGGAHSTFCARGGQGRSAAAGAELCAVDAAQDAAEDAAIAARKAAGATAVAAPTGVSYFSDAEDEMSPGAKQCLQVGGAGGGW